MKRIDFDKPVLIYFGKPGRARAVSTVFEAIHCLRNEKWPAHNCFMTQKARLAMEAVRTGNMTPAEARRAFADAALDAHILVPGQNMH
jgi:hypothetical protein